MVAEDSLPQWQKALVIYFTGILIFALVLGATLYFDGSDKEFLTKLGAIAAFLIVFPAAFRLPLSIGAFFFHLSAILAPIGVVLSVILGLGGVIPAIACFWYFASGFESSFFELLAQSVDLVVTLHFRWWHYAIAAGSAMMSMVGVYGAFRKRI